MLKKYVVNYERADRKGRYYSRRVYAESRIAAGELVEQMIGAETECRIVSVKAAAPTSKKITRRLYVAYGSNLNIDQMKHRCPDAKIYGSGTIKNYRLAFFRVASILPCPGTDVPVGVWEISKADETNLDLYEGYPRLYRKEMIDVEMATGETVSAMVYIMNRRRGESDPPQMYYETIYTGYCDFGLNTEYLKKARAEVGLWDEYFQNFYAAWH